MTIAKKKIRSKIKMMTNTMPLTILIVNHKIQSKRNNLIAQMMIMTQTSLTLKRKRPKRTNYFSDMTAVKSHKKIYIHNNHYRIIAHSYNFRDNQY